MTTTQLTNDLRHTIYSKDVEGNPMTINIRLNDECKNGHQDFSITGDIYQKGKPKTDRYFISGGCIHEDILKAKPELKIFVNLHLCDYKGIPIYAVENGFYHLRNGFNNTKPESNKFKSEFCEYYRISEDQFNSLNTSENILQYALKLQSLGILEQWENEANEAIKLLETMTEKKFLVDSKKSQFHEPTKEELNKEEERLKNGFYTLEAKQERQELKKSEVLNELIKKRDKLIDSANTEFEVKRQVLEIGGEDALHNCIYYTHSKTVSFNWRGYERISEELVNHIINSIKLPEGVQIENKNK